MRFLLQLFGQLQGGSLTLDLPDGRIETRGEPGPVQAGITVNNYRFFTRTVFGGEVGIGEAYAAGDWDSSDLVQVIRLLIENRENLRHGAFLSSLSSRCIDRLSHWIHRNTPAGARKNIADHYDLGNDFFQLFLDPTMTYSCGLYLSPEDDLETAQRNKLRVIADKAAIGPEDYVLDLGCGWGGFALQAAATTGCRVTGVTLSPAQHELASQRVREAGLEDRISILLQDYRQIEGKFDKIVSVEMLEAVGHHYLGTFFACCDRLLKPDGLMVLQVITYPDHGYDRYRRECGWIARHIFPGGLAPSLTALCNAMTASSTLIVESLENIGIHYPRTLRDWRSRFRAAADAVSALGLGREFQRKWLYYLSACEAGFATRTQNNLQLVLTRVNNRKLPRSPGDAGG